ncbi:MAG: hypothetical protein IJ190_13195 [Prevotella sp.]|nr:hypothetical protein [Prevotella sp.]
MSKKLRVILASCMAVGMLLFSYWVTSQRYAVSGETTLLRKIELVRGWFKPHVNPMSDSVLLVNVSYDPVLFVTDDSYGIPAGYDKMTDRQKLLQLLTELDRKKDYKYILLDVEFADDIHSETDSALFTLISSMDKIVIPRDYERRLADESLYDKAGLANYFTNFKFVSFAKFPYIVDGQESLPLKMYQELTGRHINQHGLFSTDGFWLARESVVLPFELRCDSAYTQEGEKVWYNLGMDLLGSNYVYGNDTIQGTDELYTNPGLTKWKYIVIGAFSSGDSHYSYLENQPGPAILFNAFLSLMNGRHQVSYGVMLLLAISFFILSYLILGQQTIDEAIAERITGSTKTGKAVQKVFGVLASWIGYSMFLTLLCIITYLWMGEVYDIFITATLFQIISILVNWIYKLKNKAKHAK